MVARRTRVPACVFLVMLLASLGLLAGGLPAQADSSDPGTSVPGDAEPGAGSPMASSSMPSPEDVALRKARETNARVEVWQQRTMTSTVEALPNGTLQLMESLRPIRVQKDGAGDHGWVPVDTTLRVVGGRVVPGAVQGEMSFSAGGSD